MGELVTTNKMPEVFIVEGNGVKLAKGIECVTDDQISSAATILGGARQKLHWMLGDISLCLSQGRDEHETRKARELLAEQSGYAISTVTNWTRFSDLYTESDRRIGATNSAYKTFLNFPPNERKRLLRKSVKEKWTSEKMLAQQKQLIVYQEIDKMNNKLAIATNEGMVTIKDNGVAISPKITKNEIKVAFCLLDLELDEQFWAKCDLMALLNDKELHEFATESNKQYKALNRYSRCSSQFKVRRRTGKLPGHIYLELLPLELKEADSLLKRYKNLDKPPTQKEVRADIKDLKKLIEHVPTTDLKDELEPEDKTIEIPEWLSKAISHWPQDLIDKAFTTYRKNPKAHPKSGWMESIEERNKILFEESNEEKYTPTEVIPTKPRTVVGSDTLLNGYEIHRSRLLKEFKEPLESLGLNGSRDPQWLIERAEVRASDVKWLCERIIQGDIDIDKIVIEEAIKEKVRALTPKYRPDWIKKIVRNGAVAPSHPDQGGSDEKFKQSSKALDSIFKCIP